MIVAILIKRYKKFSKFWVINLIALNPFIVLSSFITLLQVVYQFHNDDSVIKISKRIS